MEQGCKQVYSVKTDVSKGHLERLTERKLWNEKP